MSRFQKIGECNAEVKRADNTVLNDDIIDFNKVKRTTDSVHEEQNEYFDVAHIPQWCLQCFRHNNTCLPFVCTVIIVTYLLGKCKSFFGQFL